MTATAQLRLAGPTEARAPVVPDVQTINLTIENDECPARRRLTSGSRR